MSQVTFKIEKPVKGIKTQNFHKNNNLEFSQKRLDDFQINSQLKDWPDRAAYTIKSLQDHIEIMEKELQKSREESFHAGYEEGRESVLQETEKRLEVAMIEMKALEIKYLEAIENIEGPLLEIAKKMAEEVIGMEIKMRDNNDEVLLKRLRKLLYEVVDQNKVIVEVNPEHLGRLNSSDIVNDLNLPKKMNLSFAAGKDLKPGEAQIETEDYFVDGAYSNQLERLEEQLINKEK